MIHSNLNIIRALIATSIIALLSQSCSVDVGGNEDKTNPVVSNIAIADKDDSDGEIIGTATITWTTDEPNRSTVDIFLSSDSGATFDTTLALNESDDGEFIFDTNSVSDCRTCRIRIVPTDVVGNIGSPAESADDFIVNNVPQVLGAALYFDTGNDGVGDGDIITIPFDKVIELNASVAGDTFFVPVLGDGIGAFSTMNLGAMANEVEIKINDLGLGSLFHLHVRGEYDAAKMKRTAPSGLDILSNLAGGIIFSPDTGRTAEPLGDGIDIVPTFGSGPNSGITTTRTTAVALADLDDDGTLDAVVINTDGVIAQSVYSGDGDGTFTAIGSQGLGDNFPGINQAVAVGDIDGIDGPDIVVGVGLSQPNIVYYNNNTDGNYLVKTPLSIGNSETFAVALGDIDNNGSLDLVTGNDGPNRVWRNNGSGVLSEDGSPQLLGSSATADIALGDIDNDGDLDIVSANGLEQPNRVYRNNGAGVFSDTGQALGSSTTFSIALEDVDGDGDLDLATGNNNGQANRIWLNDGSGEFTDSGQLLGTNLTRTIVLVDIDDDGDVDMVTGNDNGSVRNKKVWFNNGAGSFSDSGQAFGDNAVFSIALGDLDGDQDVDILEGIATPTADAVWLNSQRTPTQAVFIDSDQSLGTNDSRSVASGDVDGDGDIDFVEGNFDQGSRVWLNNVDNSSGNVAVFTDSGQSLGANSTVSIALVDVDADGDLDLLTGNGGGGQGNRVWSNNGSGVFIDSAQTLGGDDTAAIAVGDIDGDSDIDLLTGNIGPNRVWRNDGSGAFSEDMTPQVLGTGITIALALGDVDGDDDLDIIAGNAAGTNQVWLNNGVNTGNFIADQALDVSITQAVTLGDVDGDGDLDLVTGNAFQNILVWINDGSPSNMFASSRVIANTDDTRSVVLRDIDADGDLDLLVGNNGGLNRTLINNGKGVYGASLTSGNSPADLNNTNSITSGDFDGDGDLDFISGNSSGEGNRLWLNDF